MCIADPHRVGHERTYYPGCVNFRAADMIIINKANTAEPVRLPLCMAGEHVSSVWDCLSDAALAEQFYHLYQSHQKEMIKCFGLAASECPVKIFIKLQGI